MGVKATGIALALAMCLTKPSLAGYEEGAAAFKAGEYEFALRELGPLAEQGDDRAQVVLGLISMEGLGAPKDPERAFKLFKTAAERGNSNGMLFVGMAYLKGDGIAADREEAQRWVERSAEKGHERAAFLNARLLLNQSGKRPEAYLWMHKARKLGSGEAASYLTSLLASVGREGPVRFSGGFGDDIGSAVGIEGANNSIEGIKGEGLFLSLMYPGASKVGQSLLDMGGKKYDRIAIRTADGQERSVFFDITPWFGLGRKP